MAATTLTIQENVPLRDKTTFRVGGPAHFFCEVSTEAELAEALSFVREKADGKLFILGGGSNILVSDEGFSGLVIFMKVKGIDFEGKEGNGEDIVRVTAGAGENWDNFVAQCVLRGFFGVENLSGIPGTVGAAPVQNIGAYGVEVAQIIESVRVYDTVENSWKVFSVAECGFEYRDSIFKKQAGRYIIVGVIFKLRKEGAVNISYKDLRDYFSASKTSAAGMPTTTPSDVRNAVLAIRAKKLPDVREIGTAGSFFKNPIITVAHLAALKEKYPDMPSFPVSQSGMVKIPLAWILDHVCGYKGVTQGNVGTYKNQALVIVNNFSEKRGTITGATAADIKKFAEEIAAAVREKTGIEIEPEVQYVG